MFNKTSFKFIGGFTGIIALALVVWYVAAYLSPEARQERDVLEYFADLEEQYENDTYGGKTPEETLALFIQALESGDIELASKYFVPDRQEEQLKYLNEIKIADNTKVFVEELSSPYEKRDFNGQGNYFVFFFDDPQGNGSMQVSIAQIPSGVWKILDL
ncbi:MAG: hypothetical protein HY457_03685 [Parcubacteria group bacterium]|nr:hypothetical protein [Parcubacteria group bacterium]